MSINNAYATQSATALQATDYSNKMAQGKADFNALSQALKAGDLDAAKTAYAKIQQDAPQKQQGTAASGQDSFQAAFASIGKALSSGDVSGAQAALGQMQEAHKAHRHGGGGHVKQPQTEAPTIISRTSSDPDDVAGGSFQVSA